MKINRTISQSLASLDFITVFDHQLFEARNLVAHDALSGRCNGNDVFGDLNFTDHGGGNRFGAIFQGSDGVADVNFVAISYRWFAFAKGDFHWLTLLGGDLDDVLIAFF